MNETKEIIEKNIKDRLASPFYGTFIFSWFAWNWKLIYITIFLDSALLYEKYYLLKTDYIGILYSDWWHNYFVWFIVLPLISTWFIIFIFSNVMTRIYKKDKDSQTERKLHDLDKEKEIEDRKRELLELEVENIEKEVEVEKKKKELIKDEDIWDIEFDKFQKTKIFFKRFSEIEDSIYKYNGAVYHENNFGDRINPIVSPSIKSYGDTNELITISGESHNDEEIELTKKGRYFMKKYLEFLEKEN